MDDDDGGLIEQYKERKKELEEEKESKDDEVVSVPKKSFFDRARDKAQEYSKRIDEARERSFNNRMQRAEKKAVIAERRAKVFNKEADARRMVIREDRARLNAYNARFESSFVGRLSSSGFGRSVKSGAMRELGFVTVKSSSKKSKGKNKYVDTRKPLRW